MPKRAREWACKGVLQALVLAVAVIAIAAFPLGTYALEDDVAALEVQNVSDPGDLDADGVVNSRDVIHMRRFIVGGYGQSVNVASGDVDGDLKVDMSDVILMRRYMAGGYGVDLVDSDIETYGITYNIANGDSYLADLDIDTVANTNNSDSYFKGQSFDLAEPYTPDGYSFVGWFTRATGGTEVTAIAPTDAKNYKLYAHWQISSYTVQYESDLFLDTNSETYTPDKGLVLPTPKLSNYIFVGWSDDTGKIYDKRIPAGTTGNLTLRANWTSERNKTYTNPNPSDPIVYEDKVAFEDGTKHNVLLLTYRIGRIENVPLYTIKNFGKIDEGGVERAETLTYTATTAQTTAETISNVVANATTNSSNWTLSNGWNESTTISEEWCKDNRYTKEEAETKAKSDSSNWNVSNSRYGSSSTSSASTTTDGWTNQVKVNASNTDSSTVGGSTTVSDKITAEVGANISAKVAGVGASVNTKIGAENSQSTTGSASVTSSGTNGFEASGVQTHTGVSSSSSSNTSGWNSASSYGGSSTTSESRTVATAISEQISQKYGIGKSYIYNGSETQGLATSKSTSTSDSYTAATTFNTGTSKSVTSSWNTQATKTGYHRWIVAGTAHVFGVVGYDIDTKSFFVSTFNVMDDETHEFEDYSYTTALYNDQENGVINFEVPYEEVMDIVSDRVFATDGLKVDLKTGTIMDYTGTDTYVVIPEYYNVGNGDVVKITGFSKDVFAGRSDIVTVVLSDFITEIPDGAFEGCTSLAFVNGKGVTFIGSRAFAGCNALEDCGVYSKVTHLGEGAFDGADMLYVNAANKDVALAAIDSGAKGLVLNLRFLENKEDVLNDVAFEVPGSMGYFELNGDGRTFRGLSIDSDAAETVLNKVNVAGTKYLPVRLASGKVTLNQSTVSSPGIALALTADRAEVGLRGDSTVSSDTANAMVSRSVRLFETAGNVVGRLVVPQKLLACGTVEGDRYLQCGGIENIDEPTFNAIIGTTMVHFDAGEGTCAESSREIRYGVPIGTLPTATRGYCTFDGWYVEGTNQRVTASTILPVGQDLTLVANWVESWTTDVADGWYSLQSSTDGTYSLDVADSRMENVSNGIAVTLWHTNFTIAQMFKFTRNADDTYTIWHVLNKLAVGAGSANQYHNPSVVLTKNVNVDNAKWYIEPSGDGYCFFRNKANGFYLDICNNRMEPRAEIQCHSRNESSAQKFLMRSSRYALHDPGAYSWSDAKAVCERIGGHLATVSSQAEGSVIEGLLSKRSAHADKYKNCYWLGGYREGTTWKWVTGEQFTYANWDVAHGQPDNANGNEDKLMIYVNDPGNNNWRMKWNDMPNAWESNEDFHVMSEFGFIIEWEDDAPVAAQSDAAEVQGPTLPDGTVQVQSEDEAVALGQDEGGKVVMAPQGEPVIAESSEGKATELGTRAA